MSITSSGVTREDILRIPLLSDLPPTQADRLCRSARIREYQRDSVLFSQGDKAETIYAVFSGRFRLVQHTLEGQDVAISVFSAGDLIGMGAVIGIEEFPGTCEAADDAAIISIPGTVFAELLEHHAPTAVKVIRLLVNRLHEAHDHIRELSAERVERRLARTVLRLAKKVGVKTEQGIRLDMPLSRQDLAELCGTTLYTVSRILSEWQRGHIVEIGRESVIINNPHHLVLIAEDLENAPAKSHGSISTG